MISSDVSVCVSSWNVTQCFIKASSLPSPCRFVSEVSPVHSSEPWRVSVLQRLRQRHEEQIQPFSGCVTDSTASV